jgi:hypothetical protein
MDKIWWYQMRNHEYEDTSKWKLTLSISTKTKDTPEYLAETREYELMFSAELKEYITCKAKV